MKPNQIDVKEIVKQYLEQNGFDGLAGDECGCLIDDFFPCDGPGPDCQPGYKIEQPADGWPEDMAGALWYVDDDCDYIVSSDKDLGK